MMTANPATRATGKCMTASIVEEMCDGGAKIPAWRRGRESGGASGLHTRAVREILQSQLHPDALKEVVGRKCPGQYPHVVVGKFPPLAGDLEHHDPLVDFDGLRVEDDGELPRLDEFLQPLRVALLDAAEFVF